MAARTRLGAARALETAARARLGAAGAIEIAARASLGAAGALQMATRASLEAAGALEMAARARPEPQWRSKWPLEECRLLFVCCRYQLLLGSTLLRAWICTGLALVYIIYTYIGIITKTAETCKITTCVEDVLRNLENN